VSTGVINAPESPTLEVTGGCQAAIRDDSFKQKIRDCCDEAYFFD